MINTQATLKISEATTTEVQRSITFDRLTGLMLASVRTLSLHVFSSFSQCCTRYLPKYSGIFDTVNTSRMSDSIRTSFRCGLRGFHVYQDIWKPVIGETLHCIHERNNIHDRYAIAATKRLPGRLADSIVGHLPREISRCTRFLISRGGNVKVTVIDSKHRRSPLVQGGLEIPVTVCIELDSTSKNMLVLERYKKLVSENYKEPINGNFDDCTKDILRDLYESSDSDEDDTSSVD